MLEKIFEVSYHIGRALVAYRSFADSMDKILILTGLKELLNATLDTGQEL